MMKRTEDRQIEPLAMCVADAARAVGVSTRTLWAEIAGNRLQCVRLGTRRRTVVRMDDLREWLDAQTEGVNRV